MARVIPLFRFDAGWPFVIAGLALLVSALLIPAQRELHELKGLVQYHRAREQQAFERLAAYDRFLHDLGDGDERVLRRLAASQLNLKLAGESSLMLAPSMNDTVVEWIDASVPLAAQAAPPAPDTLLSRLATGPRRLWILAVGTFMMFIGLFVGPETEFSGRKRTNGHRVSTGVVVDALASSGCEVKPSTSASIPSLVEVETRASGVDGCVDGCVDDATVSFAPVPLSTLEPVTDSPARSLETSDSSERESFADCALAEQSAWVSAAPTPRELRVALENEQDPRSLS